ncbi:MAG: CarD family transcriptional regulator [Ruminococcaceae bacterium]|nr:CarD family transcriptional regulator [Oscillospiraceae bacterium]
MKVQCGDMVVYGIHGVCRISDIESRMVDRKEVEYYVLIPQNQPDAKFYVPKHNPLAVAKMRKVMTREELVALLESPEVREDHWIPNEAQRKEKYRELISKADCADLICMLRALHVHRQEQLAAGKKFHQCDENFMKDAERVIRSEVSTVMDISPEDVGTFILSKIN